MQLFNKLLILSALAMVSVGCCGPMWNPGCGAGGCATGSCSTGSCGTGSCGDGGCGQSGGCGQCGGCGELYIDPWINHPADCCDPCDSCGNFNGQSCGKCRSVFAGVKSLWGYRCDDGCGSGSGACDCGAGGCDGGSCGGSDCGCGTTHYNGEVFHDEYHEGAIIGGETIIEGPIGSGMSLNSSNPRIISQPRVARQPTPARQIFQPRRVDDESQSLAY
ncbi:hypothetical protein SAMN06265222_102447 [Neorhodopirellula lusitana]|uniref:Uncharacterized protein n=1 Tax=Neorhodopirellula lusitana TaxID=445327 RepID=A0ABY1PUI3_9BACT|nr:hypothetical protein SAMN06265222_102447 [Neorhodopirellula lusitana]